MLTTVRAWVGHAAQGFVGGGYDHLHRCHLLGEDGSHGSHHQKLVMTRKEAEAAICDDGVEPGFGMWVRYSGRKRKKQERPSPEAEGVDGWGTWEGESKYAKGDGVRSAAVCSPCRQVCLDCGTSRTPLWRKGPAGPKSLCNACGIRYRKLKRAGRSPPTLAATATAAAAAAPGGDLPKGRDPRASPDIPLLLKPVAEEEVVEEEKLRRRQSRRQEVLWRLLEEGSKFELPCGKEAVEAAVLLMAMSSGLFIRSF